MTAKLPVSRIMATVLVALTLRVPATISPFVAIVYVVAVVLVFSRVRLKNSASEPVSLAPAKVSVLATPIVLVNNTVPVPASQPEAHGLVQLLVHVMAPVVVCIL